MEASIGNRECVGPSSEKAGQVSSCQGCPNQKLCASGEAKKRDPALDDVKEHLSQVKHIILVLSGKGGVGKSTVATQLAFTLSMQGYSTGLLDIDITGPSIPRMLGVVGAEVHNSGTGWSPVYVNENLGAISIGFMLPNMDDAVIWRGPKKNGMIKQFLTDVEWGELDYLIIDTPPGTSDEHLSIVQYLKEASIDGAVVVTTPQEVAQMDVRKELNFCRKTNIKILGVVENMSTMTKKIKDLTFVDQNGEDKTSMLMEEIQKKFPDLLEYSTALELFPISNGGGEEMAKTFNVPFIGRIPFDNALITSCEEGSGVCELSPGSLSAKALVKIADFISQHCNNGRV